eukprot:1192010-Prorocentrum_minimum.AAC.1
MPWQAGDRDPQPAHGSPQLEAVALHADRTGDRTGDRSGDGTGDGTGEGTGDRTSLNLDAKGYNADAKGYKVDVKGYRRVGLVGVVDFPQTSVVRARDAFAMSGARFTFLLPGFRGFDLRNEETNARGPRRGRGPRRPSIVRATSESDARGFTVATPRALAAAAAAE